MSQTKVKVFSSPNCTPCKLAREFLSSKGVEFEADDVTTDPSAIEEMIQISGAMATPVIVIGDQVIIGWDRGKVERTLNLQQK